MKHHQLRLNIFLYDNTWGYFKVEEIRIVLIKLFSSDFSYLYWQGTEIITTNPQVCLSAAESKFNVKNRGKHQIPCLFCSVPFLLCSINWTSLLLYASSFVYGFCHRLPHRFYHTFYYAFDYISLWLYDLIEWF